MLGSEKVNLFPSWSLVDKSHEYPKRNLCLAANFLIRVDEYNSRISAFERHSIVLHVHLYLSMYFEIVSRSFFRITFDIVITNKPQNLFDGLFAIIADGSKFSKHTNSSLTRLSYSTLVICTSYCDLPQYSSHRWCAFINNLDHRMCSQPRSQYILYIHQYIFSGQTFHKLIHIHVFDPWFQTQFIIITDL